MIEICPDTYTDIQLYAVYGATPPIREDKKTGKLISELLDENDQECILIDIDDRDKLEAKAREYMGGHPIFYRRSKWTDSSKMMKIETA